MYVFCSGCGTQFDCSSYPLKCVDCDSNRLSVKMGGGYAYKYLEEDEVNLGIVAEIDNQLIWTEFYKKKTYAHRLPRNCAIVSTLLFDMNNSILIDPVSEEKIFLEDLDEC